MPLGSPLPVDDAPSAEVWQEIEAVLDELAAAARSPIEPAELHSLVLERLAGLLASVGGVVWRIDREGRASVECQLHLDQSLAGDPAELARHQRLAEAAARARQPRIVPPAFRDGQAANASPWLAVLAPVAVEGEPLLVVELFQREGGRASVEEGYLRLIATACELVEEFHRRRLIGQLRAQQADLAGMLDFLERIHRPLSLAETAAEIANEARRVLACDRVSLLACRGRRPRTLAVSGVESLDRRSGVIKALESIAPSVLAAGEPLWLPQEVEALPPAEADALQSLLDETHARAIGLIPLSIGTDDDRQPVGVLAVEQYRGEFDEPLKQHALTLAQASAAALHNALVVDRIPLRGPLTWLAAAFGYRQSGWRSPALMAAIALAVVTLALVLIPAELKVEARGQLMPQRRQHLFAPSDGIVVELPHGEGASIGSDELAARLHSPALDIEQSELVGRLRTVQEDLLAAQTEALRSEIDGDPSVARRQWTARVEQLKEELRGLEAQLQIVRRQQSQLAVKSPLAGAIITWDPQRQLAGRPVKRGDALLTVADLSGPWELILDVPDERAGPVLAASRGSQPLSVSFQLGTDPGTVRRGSVASIAPATQLSPQSQPTVRVTAVLDDAAPQFRPGATVVARIHCGRRSLGYVWLHELWEGVRMRLFW